MLLKTAELGLLLASFSLVTTAMVAADPIVIEKQPWSGPQPQSPRLEPGRLGIDFALAPATGSKGPTVALLGVARLPARYGQVYAGRIEGALRIVAVDLRSSAVYENSAEPRSVVPLAKVMDPDPQPPSGGAQAEPIESYFNVDLRVQLGLPQYNAKYAVFVWLDDVLSPVRTAQIPGPPAEENPRKPIDAAGIGIQFRATPRTPSSANGIALANEGSRVLGFVSRAAQQGSIQLLTLDYRTRAFSSLSFSFPRRQTAFYLDLSVLGGLDPAATGPQKIFIVVGSGTTWSPVLVVDRKPG